jgi:phage-related protein
MIEKLKKAFQPMIELFGQIMTHVFNFVGAIAALAIKFNEAYPVLAKIIQGFLMLLPILTLILAPLAVGIGLFGGLSAAMNAVWMIIAPFVTGLATVLGTVALIAAAIVGLVAAFVLAYNHIAWFRDMVDGAWAWIKNAFFTALNFISGIVQSVMSAVSSFISGKLSDIKAFWDENGASIMRIVQLYFTAIQTYITVVLGVIKTVFQTVWPIISGVVQVAWALIQTIVGTVINVVLGLISAAMKLLQGDWEGAWGEIKKYAEDIWNDIQGYFENIDLYQIGADIINGLIDGIGDMAGAVSKKVSELASLIPEGLRNFLGIHSPSRVTMQLGEYTGEGFAIGLGDQLTQIKAASHDMATAAIPKVPTRSVDYTVQNTPTQKSESTPRTYSVEIPLVVDGREIARATVNDLDSLFAGKTRMDFRTQGGKR